jgi:cell division protein FtsL
VAGRATRPARAPFALLVVGLLTAGLIVLLMLNTKLAENSVRIQKLNRQVAALAEQEQALRQQVAAEESPQRLAEKARRQGMVPGRNPVFLDPRDGSVHGRPEAGAPARDRDTSR